MTGKAEFSKMPNCISSKVERALWLAEQSGVSTALITGKGEPLFGEKSSQHVFDYLNMLGSFRIPFVEIQTSGYGLDEETISRLAENGVTTVSISVVSDDLDQNRLIFGSEYEDPFEIAKLIHKYGMMVRLCCTMCTPQIASWHDVSRLIMECHNTGIEQLSLVPVTAPDRTSMFDKVAEWVKEHSLPKKGIDSIYDTIRTVGRHLMSLMHGGEVYDIEGVSVCIRYCLTEDPVTNQLRQVIVYPNGETRYSWTSKAARLIRGDSVEL
jgi:uncharacterized Fe-S cluster-containing radical SAM superfamily enzyme